MVLLNTAHTQSEIEKETLYSLCLISWLPYDTTSSRLYIRTSNPWTLPTSMDTHI